MAHDGIIPVFLIEPLPAKACDCKASRDESRSVSEKESGGNVSLPRLQIVFEEYWDVAESDLLLDLSFFHCTI